MKMEKYGKFGWVILGGSRGRRMVDSVEGYWNAKKMNMRGERKEGNWEDWDYGGGKV